MAEICMTIVFRVENLTVNKIYLENIKFLIKTNIEHQD